MFGSAYITVVRDLPPVYGTYKVLVNIEGKKKGWKKGWEKERRKD